MHFRASLSLLMVRKAYVQNTQVFHILYHVLCMSRACRVMSRACWHCFAASVLHVRPWCQGEKKIGLITVHTFPRRFHVYDSACALIGKYRPRIASSVSSTQTYARFHRRKNTQKTLRSPIFDSITAKKPKK